MITSLTAGELVRYVSAQVSSIFPDRLSVTNEVERCIDRTIERVEYCFSKVNNKYFFDGKNSVFNHLHGDQYAMFLYFLSNTLYRENADPKLCAKIFLLNKSLHGLDAYYEVSLPDIFLLIHPLGTVLGRGQYENYFIAYQRCGIGSNHDIYPKLGEYLTLHPGSSVLGNCNIGNFCTLGAESLLLDKDLSENILYIGNPKNAVQKARNQSISSFWQK